MLISALPVFGMTAAAHSYYDAMLPWPSLLVLLALSACIYFLCQACMSQAAALSMQPSGYTALESMHDSLIQGVQGLMLSLQATASQLPVEGQCRAQIEALLDEADSLLAQGRQAMLNELSGSRPGGELEQALASLACSLASGNQTSFCLSISGRGWPLTVAARTAIYQLARAATVNAALHDHAHRVEVELCYARDALGLRIRDDGKGYAQVESAATGQPGYAGWQEMLGHVSALQARLEIWSAPGAGTELSLNLGKRCGMLMPGSRPAVSRVGEMLLYLQKRMYQQ